MHKPIQKFSALLLTTSLLAGCQTTGNKADIGTLLGGAVGALAGSQIGSGKGRIAAILAGGAIGAFAGRAIGQMLDEQDQAAMQERSAYALANARDGQQVNWQSNRTGAQAVLVPTETRQETRQMTLIRDQRVAVAPNMELIGETYVAKSTSNVRAGASTDYPIVNSVSAGQSVDVVGKVNGANWYLISRDRVTVGYVHGDLLSKSGTVTARLQEPIDLDRVQLRQGQVVDTITASTTCRTMEYSVKGENGQSDSDSFSACKAADGSWELG
ncbi:MAG: SH3 domain-containing protein [Alphaproteobacteria bacterium]|nr:SH3 domain-containing protein [Alphaproteobacteria bacterium]MBO6629522.1 SH3 domain-containing protein [Alphaproteobacteria bacterium]MDF1625803.1 SH3 domain-containing protein [Parvibaculaceae bacterium]